MDALQAIGAARQPARTVGGLEQQEAEAQRNHDQREMPEPRDDEAHQVTEQARGNAGSDQSGDRLAPAPLGNEACGVGAEAEEGRVAQRDDAGVTEDEVERQREQRARRDLARQHQVVGRHHERQQRRQPEKVFGGTPAVLRFELLCGRGEAIAEETTDISASPENAGGPPHQQAQHDEIDQERADRREVIFAGHVAQAEQHGGGKGAAD